MSENGQNNIVRVAWSILIYFKFMRKSIVNNAVHNTDENYYGAKFQRLPVNYKENCSMD